MLWSGQDIGLTSLVLLCLPNSPSTAETQKTCCIQNNRPASSSCPLVRVTTWSPNRGQPAFLGAIDFSAPKAGTPFQADPAESRIRQLISLLIVDFITLLSLCSSFQPTNGRIPSFKRLINPPAAKICSTGGCVGVAQCANCEQSAVTLYVVANVVSNGMCMLIFVRESNARQEI